MEEYRLIYPTQTVPLRDVVRAALALCGSDHVSVVTGSGTQVVRVLESCADRVEEAAGLVEGAAPQSSPPAEGKPQTVSGPVGTDSNDPGPDTSTPKAAQGDGTPPGRPAGRPGGKTAAKKTAARGTRSKEG